MAAIGIVKGSIEKGSVSQLTTRRSGVIRNAGQKLEHSDLSVKGMKAEANLASYYRAERANGMAAKKTASRTRSRTRILHYVLSFCVTKIFGPEEATKEHPQTHGGISGFVKVSDDTPVQVDDLVLLEAAPATKWQIGWLVEMRTMPQGWTEYLIESLEDGSLCWWSDVGLCFLKRDAVQAQWRWDDRQWAFKDRWFRVCDKLWGASDDRPLLPDFGDGFTVTIGTCTSHRFDDIRLTRTFPDYRKVTKAMMAQCYAECVAEGERVVAERKAVGETV